MTRKQWTHRMGVASGAFLVVGLALLVGGSFYAGRSTEPMPGVAVGMLGVTFLAAGGLFGKFAMAGPYPKSLEGE